MLPDRCTVILFPAFWGNSPWNKDEGRLLFILYKYIFYDSTSPLQDLLLSDPEVKRKCLDLKARVNSFASKFPIPGHEDY